MQFSVFRDKFIAWAMKPGSILVVYIGAAIFAAVQLYAEGYHMFRMPTDPYPNDIMNHVDKMMQFEGKRLTDYNNYLIFKNSFFHLKDGLNLYGLYPDLHWDYYKYSPTFAFLFAPMSYMPDVAGMSVWNIFNALAVFFAIRMLPFNLKTQCLMLWFVSQELLTCLQNTQSNGLMCGLMIAAYACMHNGKIIWATLWILLATYIKVYGIIALCLFLFYPGKLKFVLYSALWTVVLFALPLVITPFHTLVWQYHNWLDLMVADAAAAVGLSVTGILNTWFGIEHGMGIVTVIGILIFLLPFARFKMYGNQVYRLLTAASMLIWVIIFNHKAESSTFIIAVAGVAIWYYSTPRTRWHTALMVFVFVFTCLSTTDIFPPYVKNHLIYPYKVKAFPCIVAWCTVILALLRLKATATIPANRTEALPVAGNS